MQESISKASFRIFFLIISSVLGVFIGLFLVILLVGMLSGSSEGSPEIAYRYSPKISPNAEGVREVLSTKTPVILKINIQGEIGKETLNKQTVEDILIESREGVLKDDRVKAIILNINSPGGTVTDANGIYRALKEYKARHKTPVYAYIDGLCASGGMYIACAADEIFASDVSIIGSVGVILGPFMNVHTLMEKLGVGSETMTAGKGKDSMSPYRAWQPDEGNDLRTITTDFYDHFVNIVASNRPLVSKEKLKDEYGAQVFNAAFAKEHGFIDHTDLSFDEVLGLLAKKIGVDDDQYQVVEFENSNWLLSLLEGKLGLGLLKGELKHTLELPGSLDPKLMNQPLYLYRPE